MIKPLLTLIFMGKKDLYRTVPHLTAAQQGRHLIIQLCRLCLPCTLHQLQNQRLRWMATLCEIQTWLAGKSHQNPLVMTNIAIENDHRNSGFTH